MSLLRPAVLPDELASGYEGRVLRYNGWTEPKDATAWLLQWLGSIGQSGGEISRVEVLAKLAGIDTGQFVRSHTTLPLRRAVTMLMPGQPHGSAGQGSVLRTVALRVIRPGAYFCAQCVEEDLDFHGVAYWRRGHQLPGVFWCAKHGGPLSYVDAKSAFGSSPTELLERAHTVSESWINALKECDPVRRFHAICADLLARANSLDEEAVSKAACMRAREIDLHVGRGKVRHGLLLSDLIKDSFDRSWLNSTLPGLTTKTNGKFWQKVDRAVLGRRGGITSIAYALAFAVLFESADAAVNAMVAGRTPGQADTRARREAVVSDADLRAAFIASRGNHSAAAKALQIGRDECKRRLNELGLPSLHRLEANSLKAAISDILLEDLTLDQACRAHGLSRLQVAAALGQAISPLASVIDEMASKPQRPRPGATHRLVAPPQQHARRASAAAESVRRQQSTKPVTTVTEAA